MKSSESRLGWVQRRQAKVNRSSRKQTRVLMYFCATLCKQTRNLMDFCATLCKQTRDLMNSVAQTWSTHLQSSSRETRDMKYKQARVLIHKIEVHTHKQTGETDNAVPQQQKGAVKEIWYVQSIVCFVTLIAFDVGHSWTQFAKRAHRSSCANFSQINICTASTSSKHTLSFLWHPQCAFKTPQSQNRLNATVKYVQPQAL